MRLVDNWKCAWRWLSVQLAIVAAAGQAAILAFPTIKDWLSDTAMHVIGAVLFLSIVFARVLDQSKSADG